MNKNDEDRLWISQVLNGRHQSFGMLVERYQDKVYGIVRRIIRDDAEAEDIAQNVFIKAFQSLHTFNHRAMFSTWLSSIAYNAAISAYRKQKQVFTSLDALATGGYNFSDQETFDDDKEAMLLHLEQLLGLLPGDDQLLVHLFYNENANMVQISEITQLSVPNIKVKLFRIRKKLLEMMENVTNTCLN